jgi:hypothetical protein
MRRQMAGSMPMRVIFNWWIEGLILAVGMKAYCPPETGDGASWCCYFRGSHIRRYPGIANHNPYCFGGGLLKSFKPATKVQKRWVRSRKIEDGAPKMQYRRLPLTCGCGGAPKHISGVGLSSAHELVLEWRCPHCHRNVSVVMSLSDCWRECFTEAPANTAKSNANLTVDTPDDRRFLHSIGVSYSDE